jgi:hypothetical protein
VTLPQRRGIAPWRDPQRGQGQAGLEPLGDSVERQFGMSCCGVLLWGDQRRPLQDWLSNSLLQPRLKGTCSLYRS